MKKNNIVFLDMDGTLTHSRQIMKREMVNKIKKLSKFADIGIVSGSPFSYINEQCFPLWDEINSVSPSKIFIMACNGTQFYKNENNKWTCKLKKNMREELGEENFGELIRSILLLQHKISEEKRSLPLTGNFISYRESSINWCPIGRDCSIVDRKNFIKLDEKEEIRKKLINRLFLVIASKKINNLKLVLGGETSLDIFPSDWDKTFALNHFPNRNIWFIGDKCHGPGNDRSIFEKLDLLNQSFSTSGPKNTLEIIDKIIEKIK